MTRMSWAAGSRGILRTDEEVQAERPVRQELIIAKQRNGPRRRRAAYLLKRLYTFENRSRDLIMEILSEKLLSLPLLSRSELRWLLRGPYHVSWPHER